MSPFFSDKSRPLLTTLFDILILVLIFYFIKGYYSITPITTEKIDDVQYNLLVFDEGDFYRLNLVVKNLSPLVKVFNSRAGHFFEMEVFKESKRLWTWSKDKFFLDKDASFTVAPNERKEFNAKWEKLDDWGKRIPPGQYKIVCRLLFLASEPTLIVKLRIKEG